MELSPWFPNPLTCMQDMAATGTKEFVERLPWNGVGEWLQGIWYWLSRIHYYDPALLLLPTAVAVVLTLLRLLLSWTLLKPMAQWFKMTTEAGGKFPESVWKVLYYAVSTTWGVLIVFSGSQNSFFDLQSHWSCKFIVKAHDYRLFLQRDPNNYSCRTFLPSVALDWSPNATMQPSVYWLYMIQMGFYLHCIYASTYLDTIRKDYALLMIHHVLTLGLLLFSYLTRLHVVGVLLVAMLDMGDLLLELSKTVFYFRDRNHKKNPGAELLANICFGMFTIQYFFGRIYWFLTKVIYSAMHVSVQVFPGGPYWLLFNPMLWILFAMQVYWFTLILRLLWKILVMGEELEDSREFKEEVPNGNITSQVNGKKRD